MRERLRQLGGDLEIPSDSEGTIVAARLPVMDKMLCGSEINKL